MSTTRMRLGALVTAGVLSFSLAACGDDEPDTTDPVSTADTQEAGDETEDETEDDAADTAPADEDTEESTDDDAAGGTDAGTDVQEGEEIDVEDFMAMIMEPGQDTLSRYTMSMIMEMDGQEAEMAGAMDISDGTPRMQVSMTVPELGAIEMLLVDGDAYMSIPNLTPEGTYLAAPMDLLGDSADLDDLDVSSQWDTWEHGAESVLYLGEEDVDGTQMRRYQVSIDPEALAAAAGEEGVDDAMTTSLGLDEGLVYDVWLDSDNLMRKLVFGVAGEAIEMRMDNWGEDPGIEAPDPSQVMQMDELTGAG